MFSQNLEKTGTIVEVDFLADWHFLSWFGRVLIGWTFLPLYFSFLLIKSIYLLLEKKITVKVIISSITVLILVLKNLWKPNN